MPRLVLAVVALVAVLVIASTWAWFRPAPEPRPTPAPAPPAVRPAQPLQPAAVPPADAEPDEPPETDEPEDPADVEPQPPTPVEGRPKLLILLEESEKADIGETVAQLVANFRRLHHEAIPAGEYPNYVAPKLRSQWAQRIAEMERWRTSISATKPGEPDAIALVGRGLKELEEALAPPTYPGTREDVLELLDAAEFLRRDFVRMGPTVSAAEKKDFLDRWHRLLGHLRCRPVGGVIGRLLKELRMIREELETRIQRRLGG